MRISRITFAFVFSAVLLFAIAAPTAKAGTTYTYAGNPYNTCSGTYCTGGPYALSVTFTTTLTGSALASLPLTDITATITSFTITDGSGLIINTVISGTTNYKDFQIATDASGNLVGWFINGCLNSCNTQMQTNWNTPGFSFQPGEDFSETSPSFSGSYGDIYDDPGTWTSQTGAVMQPNSTANLSQQFVFNNATDQHVEFDLDYTTAYNNSDLTVVSNTLPTVTNQGITHATYAQMVASTSLATTDCLTAPGEGTDSSGNSLCAQLTLTCTNANSSTPAGDNCPQSSARNLYWAQVLSTPGSGMTVPLGSAPTLAMGSDTWSPGNCTFDGPETGNLCPQSTLTQIASLSTDFTPKPGATGATSNSAMIAGCCEPEWNTVPSIPLWSNNTTVPVSFTTSPPTPANPTNGWVAAPNKSITWGEENLGATPDTTFPVATDQTVTNPTPCPSSGTWPAFGTVPPSFTTPTGLSVTVPGEGEYEVHFFSTACDNQEELMFHSTISGGSTTNLATFKTAPFNVDMTPPTVSITLNPPGGYIAQNASLTASVTCTDPSSPTVPGLFSGIAQCGSQSAPQLFGGEQTVGPIPISLSTSTPGTYTFTAIAKDVAGNSSTASVTYQVVGPDDLAIAMIGNLLVKTGTDLTYVIFVVNGGPNAADLVTVTDTLPAGASLVSSGYAINSCTFSNGQPQCSISPPTNSCGNVPGICSIGTLPAFAHNNPIGAIVQIKVSVTANPNTIITNTAVVSGANSNSDLKYTTAKWETLVTK